MSWPKRSGTWSALDKVDITYYVPFTAAVLLLSEVVLDKIAVVDHFIDAGGTMTAGSSSSRSLFFSRFRRP